MDKLLDIENISLSFFDKTIHCISYIIDVNKISYTSAVWCFMFNTIQIESFADFPSRRLSIRSITRNQG